MYLGYTCSVQPGSIFAVYHSTGHFNTLLEAVYTAAFSVLAVHVQATYIVATGWGLII